MRFFHFSSEFLEWWNWYSIMEIFHLGLSVLFRCYPSCCYMPCSFSYLRGRVMVFQIPLCPSINRFVTCWGEVGLTHVYMGRPSSGRSLPFVSFLISGFLSLFLPVLPCQFIDEIREETQKEGPSKAPHPPNTVNFKNEMLAFRSGEGLAPVWPGGPLR